jgi:hypothetical protein
VLFNALSTCMASACGQLCPPLGTVAFDN